MVDDIGWVDLGVQPEATGFGRSLSQQVDPQMDSASKSAGSRFSAGFKKAATAGMTGLVAAGALGGKALLEGFERERLGDKLAASLGLGDRKNEQLARVAGKLYGDAYGEGMEEVNNAVGTVVTSLRGMRQASSRELEAMTAKALNFAGAFDTDIVKAVEVAGVVVESGLAKNADRAFDLLTRSSQQVPAQLREDLLDASEEYSQFFNTLGFSGKDAFSILVRGSKDGMYGIDKAGDAIKEFTIRSTDMSKTSTDAYKLIGLDAEEMATKILKGGDDAQSATQQIIDGLLGIESPSTRANAAIALFGTPVEDLNVRKIPDFLRSLRGTSDELDRVKGSADRMGDTLNDNASSKITSFKRTLENDLVDFVGNRVVPVLEDDVIPAVKRFSRWFREDGGPAVRDFKDDIQPAIDGAQALAGFLGDLPSEAKIAGLATLLGGVGVAKIRGGGGGALGTAGSALGLTKPVPVLVTNPGFAGAGGLGDERMSKSGTSFGLAAGAAMSASFIPTVDTILKDNDLSKILDGKALGDKLGMPDWFAGDDPKRPSEEEQIAKWKRTFVGMPSDLGGGPMSSDLEGLAEEFKDTGEQAWGAAKMVDGFSGSTRGGRRDTDRLSGALERLAEKKVRPTIDTSDIERALALLGQVASFGMNPLAGAVAAGGLPDPASRAGVNNTFTGPIYATDTKDITRQADKRRRAANLGGRPS